MPTRRGWPEALFAVVLVRRKPRKSKIAVIRAAGQRLRPFKMDASRCIGIEIESADVRQDFLISMPSREFAEAASLVVDAELEAVTRARLDEVVDEIVRKFLPMAFRGALQGLLAQQGPILLRHELTP